MRKLMNLFLLLFLFLPLNALASVRCEYEWESTFYNTSGSTIKIILETKDDSDVFTKIETTGTMKFDEEGAIKLNKSNCPKISVYHGAIRGDIIYKSNNACKNDASKPKNCSDNLLGKKVTSESTSSNIVGKTQFERTSSNDDSCTYKRGSADGSAGTVTIKVTAKSGGKVKLTCDSYGIVCNAYSDSVDFFYSEGTFNCPEYVYVTGSSGADLIEYKIVEVGGNADTNNSRNQSSSNKYSNNSSKFDEDYDDLYDTDFEISEDGCSIFSGGDTIKLLQQILNYLRLAAIILLLVLSSLDFAGAILSGKDDGMQKASKKLKNRIIASVIIFLVPSLLNIAFYLVNRSDGICNLLGGTIISNEEIGSEKDTFNGLFSVGDGSELDQDSSGSSDKRTVTSIILDTQATAIGTHSSDNKVTIRIKSIKPTNAKNKKIKWSVVEGQDNVRVNKNGKVTGINGGYAVVRATSADNPKVYAECRVYVAHSLFENVVTKEKITVKLKYSDEKVTLKKNQKLVLLGRMYTKSQSKQERTLTVRLSNGRLATIPHSAVKFKSYYIDNPYGDTIYEEYINNAGYKSETKYLIWVNQGTERLMLFENVRGTWKMRENYLTATGDVEQLGGSTQPFLVNLHVQDFYGEKLVNGVPTVDPTKEGVMIHVRIDGASSRLGNTIHIGSLPRNTDGGNSNVTKPASHGCPHISEDARNTLYNKYNERTKDALIGSRVLYF